MKAPFQSFLHFPLDYADDSTRICFTPHRKVFAPWILVFFSVDDPIHVYKESHLSAKLYAIGFGILWGIGSVLFGQGVAIVGNALGFAIILVRLPHMDSSWYAMRAGAKHRARRAICAILQ